MPRVIAIEDPADGRPIQDAIASLRAGNRIGLPGMTAYHTMAVFDGGNELNCALHGKPARVACRHLDGALQRLPKSNRMLGQLVKRCWPGPLVVRSHDHEVTVPSHPVLQAVLDEIGTVWLSSDREKSPATASELVDIEPEVDLVLDAGQVKYDRPCSVVEVTPEGFQLEYCGILSDQAIRVSACDIYLFVCTGNTCRSPLAEGMFRKLLADWLQCSPDDLVDRGFVIQSAGIAAASGAQASPESVELLRHQGVDIGGHASQPVTAQLLEASNYIFTMTNGHREAILRYRPDLADRVEVLRRDGVDVVDPIGGGMSEYQRCETEIAESLRAIISSNIERGSN